MQLSLNGWPPVASHLACIMIGLALANVNDPSSKTADLMKLSINSVLIAVNKKDAEVIGVGQSRLFILAQKRNGKLCVVDGSEVEKIDIDKQILVRANLRSLNTAGLLVRAIKEKRLVLVSLSESKKFVQCREETRIRYESL